MAAKKKTEEMKPVEVTEEVKAEPKAEEKPRKVSIMIPYVEGEDPEVTVWVNDHCTKIRKGHMVEVTPEVAEVLQNSNKQMMVAQENRRKLKTQHQDW